MIIIIKCVIRKIAMESVVVVVVILKLAEKKHYLYCLEK